MESRFDVPAEVFNRNSVRLAFELIGSTQLNDRKVLDVGCGRGGTVALLAETFAAACDRQVDLFSPQAIAFCRTTHGHVDSVRGRRRPRTPSVCGRQFRGSDEHENRHIPIRIYGRSFSEVKRVLAKGGIFLYTDFAAGNRGGPRFGCCLPH